MTLEELLVRLTDVGAEFRAEGAALRVRAPRGSLSEDLRHALRDKREELLGYLSDDPRYVSYDHASPPLSFEQEALWFISRMDPADAAYNTMGAIELHGTLDRAALQRSLDDMVRQHDVLRAVFRDVGGTPRQVIMPPSGFALSWRDRPAARPGDGEKWARSEAAAFCSVPFALEAGPPIRGLLLPVEQRKHLLALTAHHIACDGWSINLIVDELARRYADHAVLARSGSDQRPVQYGAFAALQRARMTGPRRRALLEYWRRALADVPPVIDLPADRGPQATPSRAGARHPFLIPRELAARARRLGAAEGATPYMTLLAVFSVLLGRYCHAERFLIGTPVTHRNQKALENVIGMFANTLALPVDLSGEPSFRQLIAQTRKTVLDGSAHAELPFDLLVREMRPRRDWGRNPLFQVIFSFQPDVMPEFDAGSLRFRPVPLESAGAMLDLTFCLVDRDGEIGGHIEYATDRFDLATIRRLTAAFVQLLSAAVDDPGRSIWQLPVVSPQDRASMRRWNEAAHAWRRQHVSSGHAVPEPDRQVDDAVPCIHELFEQQAAARPDAVAVVWGDERLSYAALNEQANRLAWRLRDLNVRPESRVGVYVERDVTMAVALLAVLKAGGAFVGLDPRSPGDRIAFAVSDLAIPVILTSASLASELPATQAEVVVLEPAGLGTSAGMPAGNPGSLAGGHNLAYAIYTSGSSGRPKSVGIEHASAVSFLAWAGRAYTRSDLSGVLATTSAAFDCVLFEVFTPLSHGGTVIFADSVLALAEATDVTLVSTTPSAMATVLATCGLPASVRIVHLAGEALSRQLVTQLYASTAVERVLNFYGPSEATTYATGALCGRDGTSPTDSGPAPGARGAAPANDPPIGRPIDGTEIYVLDRHLQQVPVGVAGELCIGGSGLARGYLGRPGLTAERFIPHPFSERPGARLYRTGDLARYRSDGALEFLGRIDRQIKIRGFRVEPGEVEAVITQNPSVREAAVVADEDGLGAKRLVAYVVPEAGQQFSPALLRSDLRRFLPDYMVPAAFVALDKLPLTSNRKLDLHALPAPRRDRDGPARRPRTPQEEILCELFADVLGVPRIGVDDDFFNLGGHSLLAMKLVSRVRSVLGTEVGIRELFDAPTVAGLAAVIGSHAEPRPRLAPASRPDVVPLSFAQRRLWFLHRVEGPSPTYNLPLALRLSGALNTRALHAALAAVVRRHEVLRTIYPERDGQPYQHVLDGAGARPAMTVTQTGEAGLAAALAEAASYSFDLACELPVRAWLLGITPDEHVLVVVMHHIAADGWSVGPLMRDLSTAYAASCQEENEPELPALPVQYADYTLWQQQLLGSEDDPASIIRRQMDFWKSALDGLPGQLPLPTDRPRPARPSYRGGSVPLRIDAALHARLLDIARENQATLFMVVQAGLAALLTWHGAGTDIPIGIPIAGRTDEALAEMAGFFVNTLVLRADTSGDPSFTELLARIREADLMAYAHQDLPFERLVELLNPVRSTARHPLFQVMLAFQDNDGGVPQFAGLTARTVPLDPETARFDLTFSLAPDHDPDGRPAGLNGAINYSTDLFKRPTVQQMATHLARLFQALAGDPSAPMSRADLLTGDERQRLLADGRGPESHWSAATLAELLEEQAGRTPDAVAVVHGDHRLTYRDLDGRANRLARYLVSRGAGPEDVVALALPRSAEMVVALLAVLKAGGAYLPLDPEYPPERVAFMIGDACPVCVVTVAAAEASLPVEATVPRLVLDDPATIRVIAEFSDTVLTDADRRAPVEPANPAYVIYTSGSTGQPKGVVVEHRNLVNYALWARTTYSGTGGVAWLHSSLSFDLTVTSLYVPLVAGGRVHVAGLDEEPPGSELSFLKVTPSHLPLLPGDRPASGELVMGGEAVRGETLQHWRGGHPGVTVVNEYGPTEATVGCTAHVVAPDVAVAPGAVPIGRPIANTRVYVLDTELCLVPAGVAGELYVAGAGLSRGYLNMPALTAERFVPDPFGSPGSRMYRTGDLARWNADGVLEFAGRVDTQVSLRGFRVELGEIEAVLGRDPSVRQAVVMVREDRAGDQRLVAYIVPSAGAATEPRKLRDHLARTLPDYMVPNAFVSLEAMPLTPGGKADLKALPAPEGTGLTTEAPWRISEATELQLVDLMCDVLGIEDLEQTDNFFDLGGHSLLATVLLSRVETRFRVRVPLASFLSMPTAEGLALRVRDHAVDAAPTCLVHIAGSGEQSPLFCVHPGGAEVYRLSSLSRALGERPIYGALSIGFNGSDPPALSIPDMAAHYLAEITAIQAAGPYYLGGYSVGGLVAFEMATQLSRQGSPVGFLALFETMPPAAAEASRRIGARGDPSLSVDEILRFDGLDSVGTDIPSIRTLRARLGSRRAYDLASLSALLEEMKPLLAGALDELKARGHIIPDMDVREFYRLREIWAKYLWAAITFRAERYLGPATLYIGHGGTRKAFFGPWRNFVTELRIRSVEERHGLLFMSRELGERLGADLREAALGQPGGRRS